MANNIAVSITADVADLQVKRAIMSAELKAATKDLNTFAKEASSAGSTEGLREGMLAAASAAEKARASIAHVNVELAKSAAEARNAGHAAEEGGHGFVKMAHEVHEAAESVRTFQMRAKEFAEVYVAMFAVEKVVEFAKQMGEVAEKTKHTAEQFGMTVPEVQKLQGVATQTGIPIEALTRSFGILDKNLVTAKGTTTAMANAFKSMGVSIDDGRSQMEKFAKISDKFKEMEDGPKKAALAMLLFGKSGKELIPILNLGADGIAEMNKRTEEYGGVSEEANAKGVALAESINESKLAFEGIGNVLTSALAPVLKEIVDGLNAVVLAFVKSYKEGGIVAVAFNQIVTVVQEVGANINFLVGVFRALWDAVSDIVSALVNDLMDAFGIKAPGYFKTTELALNLFKDAFVALKDVVVILIQIIKGALIGLIDTLVMVGKIAYDAFTLNWGAIASDWKSGLDHLKSHALKTANDIKNAYVDLGVTIANAMQGKGPEEKSGGIPEMKATGEGPELGKTGKTKKGSKAKDELVAQLDAELTAKKLAWDKEQDAQNTSQEYSLQSIKDYWASALARTDLSAKARVAIETKYLAASKAVRAEEIKGVMDNFKLQEAAVSQNAEAKYAVVQRETAFALQQYGAQSNQYKAALARDLQEAEAVAKHKIAAEQQTEDAIRKLRELHLANETAEGQFLVAMGLKTQAELLANEKKHQQALYDLDAQALEKRMELLKLDPTQNADAMRKLYADIQQAKQQHENKLTEISRKAILARTANERHAMTSTSSLFAQNLSTMLTLQQGFATTVGNLYKGMVNIVAGALGSIIQKWLEQHLAGLILGTAASKTAASAEVATNAAVAGSGAYASTAAIPVVGPELAPAAAAAAYAGAMSFQGMLAVPGFAVGAWNLSQDQLAMVHSGEMIIPAAEAGGMRNMLTQAANGNSPMAANEGGAIHLHFNGPTSKREVEKWIADHHNGVAEGVRRAARANVRM